LRAPTLNDCQRSGSRNEDSSADLRMTGNE
jgi:hypothetical protein